jgi:hypothetical protein
VHERVTFVIHDWGSALGFDWANRHREVGPDSDFGDADRDIRSTPRKQTPTGYTFRSVSCHNRHW